MIRFLILMALTTVVGLSLAANESYAASPGFLEGDVKIVTSRGANLAEDNQSSPPNINYAEYPIVVLDKEGREEITRITADENGHYRVSLPPGQYVLSLKARARKSLSAPQQPFTVVSQQTVHVDLQIRVGLSVSGP